MQDRIPPNALEAEEALLGSILVDRGHMVIALEHVSPSDFYAHVHDSIFSAMVSLHGKHEPLDKISVAEELRNRGILEKVGGASYLSRLMDTVQTASSAEFYAKVIREKARLRGLIAAGAKITSYGFDGEDDVDSAIAASEKVLFTSVHQGPIASDGYTVSGIGEGIYVKLVPGVKPSQLTPWPTLNRLTGGFFPGEFIAWPAAPKVGKSALINQLADYISAHYGQVLYFPLEMGREATVRRLLATYTGIQSRKLRLGELVPSDYDLLMQGIDVLRTRNMIVFGRGKSVSDIRRIAQRYAAEGQIAAVIVDHPGFLRDLDSGARTSKHEKLDAVYRGLLDIANSLQVVMHVVQHVNRDGMKGEPTLAHIRDGGNIEGHANAVIAPYRPHTDSNDPEEQRMGKFLILANRDGESGYIPDMQFIGSRHLWLESGQRMPDLHDYLEAV